MPGQHRPMRLPPLPRLRVHNPTREVENPCLAIMSTVLGCLAIENQLRQCMDGPKAPRPSPNTINYHLGRMKKFVTHQGKKS